MKKTVFSLLIIFFIISFSYAQSNEDFEVEQLRDGTLAIIAYNGTNDNVTFPARLFGINVSEIRLSSNSRNRNIKTLTIQNGIRRIGDNSFGNFNTAQDWFIFKEIRLPDSILEIGNKAFYRSLSTTNVINLQLSNRLRSIGEQAFADWGRRHQILIRNLILPNSLEFVGNRAFANLIIAHLKIDNAFRVNTTRPSENIFDILYGETSTQVFSNTEITCIEICSNLSDEWLNSVFDSRSFINFYVSQNRRSGFYFWNERIWTFGTRQDLDVLLSTFDTLFGQPPSSRTTPEEGTTRDPSFQREYEEAVREYDQRMQVLPPNLILPGGQTVRERIESGNVGGK
jgi:hypothetical protein